MTTPRVAPKDRQRRNRGITPALGLMIGIGIVGALLVSRPAYSQSGAQSGTQPETAAKTEKYYLAVVTGDDVYVRSGGADSYYPFGKLHKGDVVKVIGEKHNWARIRTTGPAFRDFFAYVRYPTSDAGRFQLDATGRKGRTLGLTRALAPNLNTNYEPDDSWKRILLIEADREVDVLETTESDRAVVHKIVMPPDAEGWISTAFLEPASPRESNAWEAAIERSKLLAAGAFETSETTPDQASRVVPPALPVEERTTDAAPAANTVLARGEDVVPMPPMTPALPEVPEPLEVTEVEVTETLVEWPVETTTDTTTDTTTIDTRMTDTTIQAQSTMEEWASRDTAPPPVEPVATSGWTQTTDEPTNEPATGTMTEEVEQVTGLHTLIEWPVREVTRTDEPAPEPASEPFVEWEDDTTAVAQPPLATPEPDFGAPELDMTPEAALSTTPSTPATELPMGVATTERAMPKPAAPPSAFDRIAAAIRNKAPKEALADLEAAYQRLRSEPIETAEVLPLRHLYQTLASASTDDRDVALYAKARAEQLSIWADLQQRRGQLEQLRARLEVTAEEAEATRLSLEQAGTYAAVGRLAVSTVYDGVRLPRLYRVQDAATGRTIIYLRPDKSFDLPGMLGQVIGVIGRPTFEEKLRLNLVKPKRIDLLARTG